MHTIIQNKYENLNEKRIRLLKEINIKDYSKVTKETKIAFLSTLSLFQSEISFNFNFTHIINQCLGHVFNLTKFNDFMDIVDNYTKRSIWKVPNWASSGSETWGGKWSAWA